MNGGWVTLLFDNIRIFCTRIVHSIVFMIVSGEKQDGSTGLFPGKIIQRITVSLVVFIENKFF